MIRVALAAAVLVSSAVIMTAADTPAIRLDAVITDRLERPVRDLKVTDFEISDAGEARPIDAITLQSGRDGRLIAIFLDEYHVRAGANTERARSALLQFVATELRPNDRVAIMKPLDSIKAIQVLNVGPDRAKIVAQIQAFEGRKGDYSPVTAFERDFVSRAPATADASRAQIVSSAMQALALRLGVLRESRKSVVLVSEGFSPSLARGSDRLTGSLRAMVYAANRFDVAIYPVDPSEESPVAADGDTDAATLRSLAQQTGGGAAVDQPDLLPALKQAASDLDAYYIVTYKAATSGDGKFHSVQLRVKRADAQIRTRSGYWSASAELLKPLDLPVAHPNLVPARPPHSSLLIRQWVGTSRGDDGATNVTVSWEPGMAPPRNQQIGSVELKATTDEGKVLFDGPVVAGATFTAAAGPIHLEMIIRNTDGRTLDSDYRGVIVPNLRVSRLTFATIEVMRTRNAREFQQLAGDLAAIPAASRNFSRAERLLLRVPVYGPGSTPPTVTATLQNNAGTPMRQLDLVEQKLSSDISQFDLPLSFLAPDDYRVELTARQGAETVKTAFSFRVSN